MKEYTIKMNFIINSKDSDYEDICIFAEELAEKIIEDEKLIYKGDIEIVETSIEEVEDHNEDNNNNNNFEEDDY